METVDTEAKGAMSQQTGAAGPAQGAGPQSPRGGPARPVGARAVGSFVPRLTRPAFERFGFSAATLITDWATIVGADIARYTAPERLRWPRRIEHVAGEVPDGERGRPGATLFLGVEAARALDVQYKARQIIERINAYFGYRAVSELRIVQAASRPSATARGAAPVPHVRDAPSPPPAEVTRVADAGLRAALERMAAGLVSRKLRAPGAG
jgi:hypothetical protein